MSAESRNTEITGAYATSFNSTIESNILGELNALGIFTDVEVSNIMNAVNAKMLLLSSSDLYVTDLLLEGEKDLKDSTEDEKFTTKQKAQQIVKKETLKKI